MASWVDRLQSSVLDSRYSTHIVFDAPVASSRSFCFGSESEFVPGLSAGQLVTRGHVTNNHLRKSRMKLTSISFYVKSCHRNFSEKLNFKNSLQMASRTTFAASHSIKSFRFVARLSVVSWLNLVMTGAVSLEVRSLSHSSCRIETN